MEYALLFYETQEEIDTRDQPENAPEYWGAWAAYIGAVEEAGIMTAGAGLERPDSATTLRIRDGKRDVQDGPFAETKEMLGGFIVIDVPDLDTALEWASRSPSATTASVEVRPKMPDQGDS